MKKLISVLMAIIMLVLTACTQPVSAGILQSEKPRVTEPQASQADLATLVDGNSEFAFGLYHALGDTDGNLFYSPHSISLALAMTYAGARGDTEEQMADTVRFLPAQNDLHPAFNILDIELASRGEEAKGKDEEGFRFNIVNTIWGQKDYVFISEFLDTLAENYGTGLRILDFIQAPEESRITINNWVSDQTEERIKDLIPQGTIDALTRLILTNAIYFNAAWQFPFDEDATADGTFYLLNDGETTVPMMRQTESFGYTEGDNYQAVELTYDGRELSMVILLPASGQLETFEDSIDYRKVDGIISELENHQISLTMPKFKYESEFSLKRALTEMGMPIAFTTNADFSGMTGNQDLFIDEVIHKAFVSVDETGTEAAAATAVIMSLTAIPAEPIPVTLDRPFVFLIRDIETGVILFIGRVLNPLS
ncbi:serpin family protein [Chloroflexota bacterium]